MIPNCHNNDFNLQVVKWINFCKMRKQFNLLICLKQATNQHQNESSCWLPSVILVTVTTKSIFINLRKSLSNYQLIVINISKKYADILRVYKVLPTIDSKIFSDNKITNKNTKNNYVTTRFGKNKIKYNFFQWIKDCEKVSQDLKQIFLTISSNQKHGLKPTFLTL